MTEDVGRAKAARTARTDRVDVSTAPRARGAQPYFIPDLSIDQYDYALLRKLVRWVESDGRLRTDEDILHEVAKVLGFQRVGNRIRDAIGEVTRDYRRGGGQQRSQG